MQAGRLDRRIVIQSFTSTVNAFGEAINTWTTFATVWAQFEPKGVSERFTSGQRLNERVVTFRVRHNASITTQMRVLYGSDTYEIHGLTEIGRKQGLDLICRAVRV